jgi:Zn-dependent M28 family amino/carboxypeptidase
MRVGLAAWMLGGFAGWGRAADPYAFNGSRAFSFIERLVDFGPRPAGSKALAETRQWIVGQLQQSGWTVERDAFTADTPIGPLPMVNLIAKLPGVSRKVIMVAGHYDTKRFTKFRFVGANDGGSSAAFLLELARILPRQKHRFTYWLVFFDGEEAILHWTATDSLYGSRHLVARLTSDGKLGRIQAMILVDMVAGNHLVIHRDADSTAWLNKLVFHVADRLGYQRYFRNTPTAVDDDHVPFVDAGVSAIDLIGLDYGPDSPPFGSYWHTAQDTVQHCSPASLTIVGRVVLATLEDLNHSPHLPP